MAAGALLQALQLADDILFALLAEARHPAQPPGLRGLLELREAADPQRLEDQPRPACPEAGHPQQLDQGGREFARQAVIVLQSAGVEELRSLLLERLANARDLAQATLGAHPLDRLGP